MQKRNICKSVKYAKRLTRKSMRRWGEDASHEKVVRQ